MRLACSRPSSCELSRSGWIGRGHHDTEGEYMSAALPPVIVVGMHRSGTSLLTRALQDAGLFMGLGATRNEEARFTNALNAWVFREASATWDRPESIDQLLADDELRPWVLDYLGGVVGGPASIRFLGPRRWLRDRGLDRVAEPWGWKDPRNTFTLPLWLELFPGARVLHIVRHGVDVAASLRTRRARALASNVMRYRRRRRLYLASPLAPKRRGFGPQVRCGTLEGGFSLWESYVTRAREHVDRCGNRALEIDYESLLTDPEGQLRRALDFCGLDLDDARITAAAGGMDPARAHAWRGDPELREFAAGVNGRLARLGYGADVG